jgi:hypothetical protein
VYLRETNIADRRAEREAQAETMIHVGSKVTITMPRAGAESSTPMNLPVAGEHVSPVRAQPPPVVPPIIPAVRSLLSRGTILDLMG